VAPRGVASNALGVGAKLRLYADGLALGATCRDGLVTFGLGRRSTGRSTRGT